MRARPPLTPGPHLVVGLARSGEAAALALRAAGEQVIGCDAGSPQDERLARSAGRLSRAGVEVHLDAPGDDLAARARTLIKSPGVPQHAPAVAAARALGVPVMGELELAWRMLANEFVAVTGTNGKTTTTEWIGHIHRCAGVPVAVAGNVGTAASSLVGSLAPEATVVCEASSFQLEDTLEFAPEVAVLLNLAPDHLDRHGSFEAYAAAKLRIFAKQTAQDISIVPVDLDLALPGEGRRVRFGAGPQAKLRREGERLLWDGEPLIGVGELALPGEHNVLNAMAAAAACMARGLPAGAVAEGLAGFSGVAHRLELVCERDGVAYVNDSKATNVASALVALASFRQPVHLIAGGRAKGEDFGALAPAVAAHCAGVYLLGEAAAELERSLAPAGVPVRVLGDLERAVRIAATAARPGEVVLLSPACASFDQYRSFEERGEHFRALARGGDG
ncbi:MAG TPA: UDP-N-acetylmuramoyl-L-alanine--D-glutamate ligase [Solirubrobacteraceae bacterium]|nr:UDP-N-acetylmuramoyl-L-alanine--D-glutamate ligase [Solirubrobacteraceae bacterium]